MDFSFADKKYYAGCMADDSDGKTICVKDKDNCKICNESKCNAPPSDSTKLVSQFIYVVLSCVFLRFY